MAVNRRIFVLAFVGFLVLTNCIFVLLWGNFYTSSDKVQTPLSNVTPVVILKLPRSGSSWFTSLFNQLEYVYVTKEIVQGKDKDLYNTNTLLTHLIKALSEPSSKIAFSSFKYLSGRYWEDFIFKGKLRTSLRILGFTLNPEHVSGLDWNKVFNTHRGTRLVILVRSNIIKSAVSSELGNRQKALCGVSNTRKSTSSSPVLFSGIFFRPVCMEGQLRLLNWTASQCRSEINIWSDRYRRFFRQIHKMIPFLQFPPIIVRYESLQANSTGVLESLVLHLAPTIVQSTHTTKASDEWSKRTPENLRIVLTNFDEIHTLLSDSSCQTLLQMLVDDSARIFNPADSLLHVKDSSPYSCEASSDISYIQTIFQQSIIL